MMTTAPHTDEHGNFTPEPGTEYPFSVSDIARATARVLGQGWSAEAGPWGVAGVVAGPYDAKFGFEINYDGNLCISYKGYEDAGLPDHPDLPDKAKDYDDGVYLEQASACDGLEALAERASAVIRAVTGYDPDDFDFESSVSRQHHIHTGRYLRKGGADKA